MLIVLSGVDRRYGATSGGRPAHMAVTQGSEVVALQLLIFHREKSQISYGAAEKQHYQILAPPFTNASSKYILHIIFLSPPAVFPLKTN